MRDDTLDIIVNNMFLDPDKRKKLTERQENLLLQVSDCYNVMLQKKMVSKKELRNYLINKYKVTQIQAYRIIEYTVAALGNLPATHKNWVRQRVEFLIEEAYSAAKAKNYKLSESLTKMAKVYANAFSIDQDEGELIDAQKYLELPRVEISINPESIGITISDVEHKEIDKMCKQYEITDAEYEEVEDDGTVS